MEERSFVKNDKNKPRTDLLPPLAILEVAKVLAFGSKKYPEPKQNWRLCKERSRYSAAALRHIFHDLAATAYPDLVDSLDDESRIEALAHAACSILFELELLLEKELKNEKEKSNVPTLGQTFGPYVGKII